MQQKTYAWTSKGGEKYKARGETVTCSRKGCDEKFPEEIKIGRWETPQFCSNECKISNQIYEVIKNSKEVK